MNAPDSNWFAVYTRPRQEQVALVNLERQQFDCFLPMTEAAGRRSAKSSLRREPLFPRYLFVRADPAVQSLASVRSTRGAVGLVRAGFELIKVPATIIEGLKTRVQPTTGLIALTAETLRNGEPVRVCDGPLAALEGVFHEHRGRSRSVMLIEILGQQTAVEVDPRLLRRVG